ncbi:MAG TPA: methyltransferase domain-containing protein [Bacteroidia bacterium]|nr:methyltransferase domain-containing protein [Bacteroidia bacterium]
MHPQFLPYLVDPVTKEPLQIEAVSVKNDCIETGFLVSSTNRYPIIRGIPRFVEYEEQGYSKNFGYQWRKWPRIQFEAENKGKPMEGHTKKMWELITGHTDTDFRLDGQMVLDMGCGPGRFTDVARSKGAKVIGIDFSLAVEAAHENFKNDHDTLIIQGDALNLPLKPGSMDGAFSIGVLHHTPDPATGVKEAAGVLKDHGWFGLCVYEKNGYYDKPMVQFWRIVFKKLWRYFKHYPPLIYSYFTVYVLSPLAPIPLLGRLAWVPFPYIRLADKRWSLLDTFDSITPSYQSAHSPYEIFQWFKKNGFSEIEPTNWGTASCKGVIRK